MIYTRANAIFSLVPDADCVDYGDYVQWKNYEQPPITEQEIQAEVARLQAEYERNEYQRQRAQEYPPITDQLDTLYHGGYDAWKASIDAVKLKYPKPE
jgi:hypothetical protein